MTEDGKNRWSTKWNAFSLAEDTDLSKRLPTYPASSPWPADDVKFTSMLLDDVEGHLAIDRGHEYASGFSNGGSFSARLASELSDRFAAIATSGAPTAVKEIPPGRKPAPLWQVLGSQDPLISQKAGLPLPFPMDAAAIREAPKLGTILAANISAYGLAPEPCKTETDESTTTLAWCAPGQPDYRFTMVKDMTHVYPNGYDRTSNPSGVVAVNQFWTFFQQHKLP